MDERTRRLTPRRRHWGVEPDPAPEIERVPRAGVGDRWTRDEERSVAKRLLWRDSATILVGIMVALLAIQLFFRSSGGGAAPAGDATGTPNGVIVGPTGPSGSRAPDATLGPILDPGLGTEAPSTPDPLRTLPPTGSQRPATPAPIVTPRPPTPRPPTAQPPTPSPPPATPTPAMTPTPTGTPTPIETPTETPIETPTATPNGTPPTP